MTQDCLLTRQRTMALNRYCRLVMEKETGMTDDEVLAHFTVGRPDFQTAASNLTAEEKSSLCAIARIVHDVGMDWYFTGTPGDYFRIGCKTVADYLAGRHGKAFGYLLNTGGGCRLSFNNALCKDLGIEEGKKFLLNPECVSITRKIIDENKSVIERKWRGVGLWPDAYRKEEQPSTAPHDTTPEKKDVMTDTAATDNAVNLILYGPPGTGKTYATAAEAIALCGVTVPENRANLMAAYHRLMRTGQIEFVTFHQSIAYEDFIEGLRPLQEVTPSGAEGGQPAAGFTLAPQDGVFRRIVRAALGEVGEEEEENVFSLGDRRVFKLSMGVANDHEDAHIFENAIRDGYAIIGYGEVDFTAPRFSSSDAILRAVQESGVTDKVLTSSSGWVKMLNIFRNQMRIGDIIVVSRGNTQFRAIGQVTGDYYFEPLETRPDYAHRRRVKWVWVDPKGQPVGNIYAKDFSMAAVYQLGRSLINVPALGRYVNGPQDAPLPERKPYVLIIDEINRANISKVFGELITLLEPDKRLGKPNELQVRLPYSGDQFGVPPNLHIVGTMNTADRSIALLDTALRRRFDFRELMPDPTRLETVGGIDLAAMLRALNERIEYLFDREHQIGHAYFIGCQNRASIDRVMRDRIIPLLAEYFYEDWDKVAAVLGDADEAEGDHKGGFLIREKLLVPRGLGLESEGSSRYRWRVRTPQEGFDYTKGLLGA